VEISGKPLNEKEMKVVRDHLKLVFDKKTPEYPITTYTVPYPGGAKFVTDTVTTTAGTDSDTDIWISPIPHDPKVPIFICMAQRPEGFQGQWQG